MRASKKVPPYEIVILPLLTLSAAAASRRKKSVMAAAYGPNVYCIRAFLTLNW